MHLISAILFQQQGTFCNDENRNTAAPLKCKLFPETLISVVVIVSRDTGLFLLNTRTAWRTSLELMALFCLTKTA